MSTDTRIEQGKRWLAPLGLALFVLPLAAAAAPQYPENSIHIIIGELGPMRQHLVVNTEKMIGLIEEVAARGDLVEDALHRISSLANVTSGNAARCCRVVIHDFEKIDLRKQRCMKLPG